MIVQKRKEREVIFGAKKTPPTILLPQKEHL